MAKRKKTRYEAVEDTTAFDFSNLAKRIKEQIKIKKPDISTEDINLLILKNLKKFTINNQYFDFHVIPVKFGGMRWYVKCPKCESICSKLYLPTKFTDRIQKYLCKDCHKLRNRSLILGSTKKYKEVVRPIKRMEIIRDSLLKTHIPKEKAELLLKEYEDLENKLKNSNEYKLWKFRNEHSKQGQ